MIWNPLAWPRWAQTAGAAAALIAAFLIWLAIHDRSVIDQHEAGITRQVEAKSSQAAAAASEAVQQSQTETERSNDEARNAAADSDDPLRAGLDSLRGAPSHRPTAH